MSSTPAVFPTSIVTFTTKVNHIDVVNDDDCNKPQNEIIALQTYIGTNPQGNKSDLTTRIGIMIATNGAWAQGSSFPTNPIEGQAYWRTDLKTLYAYNATSLAWQAIGASPSNVLFQYSAVVGTAIADVNNSIGEIFSSSLSCPGATNPQPNQRFIRKIGTATDPVTTFKMYKISGMSTVRFQAQLWGSGTPLCTVNIGGVSGTATGAASSVPVYYLSNALDISGLGNGTYYDIVVKLSDNAGSLTVYIGNLIGFCS